MLGGSGDKEEVPRKTPSANRQNVKISTHGGKQGAARLEPGAWSGEPEKLWASLHASPPDPFSPAVFASALIRLSSPRSPLNRCAQKLLVPLPLGRSGWTEPLAAKDFFGLLHSNSTGSAHRHTDNDRSLNAASRIGCSAHSSHADPPPHN